MGTMKRLLMVLVAVFVAASTSALAGDLVESKTATLASKAVQMTDEQLDEITAAGAFVEIFVSNPGNAVHLRETGKKFMCINCPEHLSSNEGGTFVLLGVQNPSHTIVKCLGRCPVPGF